MITKIIKQNKDSTFMCEVDGHEWAHTYALIPVLNYILADLELIYSKMEKIESRVNLLERTQLGEDVTDQFLPLQYFKTKLKCTQH